MNVLIACENSGTVREAFRRKGHNAWSCDLLPTDIEGQHIQGDALAALKFMKWDLIIAHPPCTRLSNSGVCWLAKRNLWKEMEEGANFFKAFLDADCPRICIENPIQHKYARAIIKCEYSQIIQPWMFGHPESKATCLWLKGLPLLKETNNVKATFDALPKREQQRLHYLSPSADRWKLRSKTFDGIAEAMASQWGNEVHSFGVNSFDTQKEAA